MDNNYLVSLTEISNRPILDKKNVGGKAYSLYQLTQAGVKVPKAYCLQNSFFKYILQKHNITLSNKVSEIEKIRDILCEIDFQSELSSILESGIATRDISYAVRSSGSLEDLHDASFAGLYETYLNQKGKQLIIDSIKNCYLAAFNPRVIDYCVKKGCSLEQISMSVIIQEMIPADKSGVCFSVDPVNGYDKVHLIEAVYGLGEYLVSGCATPSQYYYNWFKEKLTNQVDNSENYKIITTDDSPYTKKVQISEDDKNGPILSLDEIKTVSCAVSKIQIYYGHPVDVEWCLYKNNLYILQSRPITHIGHAGFSQQWTTADFKDGGVSSSVCTPYMWSLYKIIWENALPNYLKKIGIHPKYQVSNWGEMFYGRPYWNVTAVKDGAKKIPGFCEKDFDQDLGICVDYEGSGHQTPINIKTLISGVSILMKLKKSFKDRLRYNENFAPNQKQSIKQLRSIDFRLLSRKELGSKFKEIIFEKHVLSETSYFNHIFDNSNYKTLFKDKIKKIPNINYLNFMVGLNDLSHLRPIIDLWELAKKIQKDQSSLNFWIHSNKEHIQNKIELNLSSFHIQDFKEYVQKYAYKSEKELDISYPRYDEDYTLVMDSLKQFLINQNMSGPLEQNIKQHNNYLDEIEKLKRTLGRFKSRKLIKDIETLRDFLWWREELRDLSTQMYYIVRKVSLEVARRLLNEKSLIDINDIFFLDINSAYELFKNPQDKNILNLLEKNKKYYRSYQHYTPSNEIGFKQAASLNQKNDSDTLKGIACSPGKITARAIVLDSLKDVDQIKAGDILVTKFTDPAWTPVFSSLSGIITETGGVLSHAAVISREYGIPSVLAVANACIHIKSGDMITLDGNQGIIHLAVK